LTGSHWLKNKMNKGSCSNILKDLDGKPAGKGRGYYEGEGGILRVDRDCRSKKYWKVGNFDEKCFGKKCKEDK